jgi:predicted nucleotidyltransferase
VSVSVEESAARILQRAQSAREERERNAARVRELVIGRVRAQLPTGTRAWLIGSLAWGGFGDRSDVDLVLSGVATDVATRIESAIAAAAGVEVDVLYFDELPPDFQRRVEHEGVAISGA